MSKQNSFWSKVRQIKGRFKELNSYLTLYEESIKEKFNPDEIDELIIFTKDMYLKFDNLEQEILWNGITD